jgi:hypothetical protein
MNELINNQQKISERADQQLQLIEDTLKGLLAGVSLEDLVASQRLNFATRLLLPYARILALQHTIARQSASEEDTFLDDLRQHMRIDLDEMVKGEHEE